MLVKASDSAYTRLVLIISGQRNKDTFGTANRNFLPVLREMLVSPWISYNMHTTVTMLRNLLPVIHFSGSKESVVQLFVKRDSPWKWRSS